MKVYLDDKREAPEGWTQTYSAQATIWFLKSRAVTHLSLDHDLGDEKVVGTGYDVLLWLEEQVLMHGFTPPKITVHTSNEGARPRMEQAVENIEAFIEGSK